jgi:hypothetical protein
MVRLPLGLHQESVPSTVPLKRKKVIPWPQTPTRVPHA